MVDQYHQRGLQGQAKVYRGPVLQCVLCSLSMCFAHGSNVNAKITQSMTARVARFTSMQVFSKYSSKDLVLTASIIYRVTCKRNTGVLILNARINRSCSTSGENIGDSGLIQAFRAWKAQYKDETEFLLPGLNYTR